MPNIKKSMQYFLGKINFISRFISYFVETIKHIQQMINKDTHFRCIVVEKEAFQ